MGDHSVFGGDLRHDEVRHEARGDGSLGLDLPRGPPHRQRRPLLGGAERVASDKRAPGV